MTKQAIATPSQTKRIMNHYGLTLKKSLGQNFLIEPNVLQQILQAAQVDDTSAVLEIGPGIGALTEVLAERANRVIAVELDRRLLPVLNELFSGANHVTFIEGDILDQGVRKQVLEHLSAYPHFDVVANLPYYITTPIIMGLLEAKLAIRHLVVMIQKEVAQRMTAQPGGKDYGSLSIAVQYYAIAEQVSIVPPTVFIPRPKVDSAIMRLTMRSEPAVEVRDEAQFFRLVRASFAHRRKTIANNLTTSLFGKENRDVVHQLLLACDIDPMRRGETLSLQEFALLSNAMTEHSQSEGHHF